MIEQSGLIAHYRSEKDGQDRVENLEELITAAESFVREAQLATDAPMLSDRVEPDAPSPETGVDEGATDPLTAFLAHAALEAGETQAAEGRPALQLMTVHSAKGLEFHTVFVTGLEEGLFPHENSLSEADGLEEERRLMYVAITRARRRLYITLAQRRMLHGQTRYNIPSRFVGELPPELVQWLSPYRRRAIDVDDAEWERVTGAPQATPPASQWRIGQSVRHAKFGLGVIIDADGRGADTQRAGQFPRLRREVAGAGLREARSGVSGASVACVGCVARKSSTAADADGKNRSRAEPVRRRASASAARATAGSRARSARRCRALSNSSCRSRSARERRDVDVRHRLQVEHDAAQRRLGGGDERAQAVRDVARVGEDERRVQAVHEHAGRGRAAFVVGEVVEAPVGGQPPQQRVARPRDFDQDARERQADAEQHAGQHAEHAARPACTRDARGRTRADRARTACASSARRTSRTPAATRIADSATRGSASSAGARNSTNATSSAAAIHCVSCVCAPVGIGGDRARRARADGKSADQSRRRCCRRRARRAPPSASTRLAPLGRERARQQHAFREHEQRERDARRARATARRAARWRGSDGAGIAAAQRLQVDDAARGKVERAATRRSRRRTR